MKLTCVNRHLNNSSYISATTILCMTLILYSAIIISLNTQHKQNTFLFYCFIILLSSFTALVSQSIKDIRFSNIILIIALFILSIPYVFRDLMGTDDIQYHTNYTDIVQNGWIKQFIDTTREPGYLLLNKICSYITSDYTFCRILCGSIPFIIFYKAFTRYNQLMYYYIAILQIGCCLYFNVLEAALIRIFIAISIVFYSLKYLLDGNLNKYLITIFIAMLFHYSSGVMLIFTIFFYNKQYYLKHPFRSFLILIIILLLIFSFVTFAATQFLGTRYLSYVFQENSSLVNELSIMDFDTLPFIIFGYIFRKKIPKNEIKNYNCFLIIYSMSLVIACFSILIPLGRLMFYFNCSLIFLASYWYRYSTSIIRFWIISLFTFYCCLYAYITKLSILDNNLYPYKGLFFNI